MKNKQESLKLYQAKRDFKKTSEPKAKILRENRNRFVIQKHQAFHLHYDLRLEMEGVLRSWAVPKEPPLSPGIKRLAVAVEEHPVEYLHFEGIIPEGLYGTGKVEIWDKGEYQMELKEKDKLIFHLKGEKLKGRYVLLQTSKGQWLFFKSKPR